MFHLNSRSFQSGLALSVFLSLPMCARIVVVGLGAHMSAEKKNVVQFIYEGRWENYLIIYIYLLNKDIKNHQDNKMISLF